MVTPLGSAELLTAGTAGAAVVMLGGLYALFLALGLMRGNRAQRLLAYVFFALLGGSLYALSRALRLDVLWNAVLMLLLVAYLVAPHLIWHLTLATHARDAGHQGQTSTTTVARTRI